MITVLPSIIVKLIVYDDYDCAVIMVIWYYWCYCDSCIAIWLMMIWWYDWLLLLCISDYDWCCCDSMIMMELWLIWSRWLYVLMIVTVMMIDDWSWWFDCDMIWYDMIVRQLSHLRDWTCCAIDRLTVDCMIAVVSMVLTVCWLIW